MMSLSPFFVYAVEYFIFTTVGKLVLVMGEESLSIKRRL